MNLLTDLISLWKLDEESGVRVDSHGSNDLADNNTVLFDTGKIVNAANFELDNDEYLSIADNPSLSFGDEDFTGWCWAKLETKATMGLMAKWNTQTPKKEYFLYYISAAVDRFRFSVSDDAAGTNVATVTDTQIGEPDLGVWYFLVFWHDADANEIGLLINDGVADTVAHTHGVHDGTGQFYLGRYVAAGPVSRPYDGLLDEVGLIRRLLSTSEKTRLFNGGAGLPYENYGYVGKSHSKRQFMGLI